MKCPQCHYPETKVIDSRIVGEGESIRRRRECLKCTQRFTTYEHIEQLPLMVIKRDGRRQPFDRERIVAGLVKACEKRPVSVDEMEKIAQEIERDVQKKFDREVASKDIGELVMERLVQMDEVAYVRFASVYRQFKDVSQFMSELKGIIHKSKK